MSNQASRPEVEDPRVLALAQARQQLAHNNTFGLPCPSWDGLTRQEQDLSLAEARNWLHAALDAGLVADRAMAWRELADRANPANEASWFGDFGHMVGEWMRDQADQETRRLTSETPAS